MRKLLLCMLVLVSTTTFIKGETYYFHPKVGNDRNDGKSQKTPFQSLTMLSTLTLKHGDSILLAGGFTFPSSLVLKGMKGKSERPIVISSYSANGIEKAKIDAKGYANAVLLEDCSFITVDNLMLTANGGKDSGTKMDMRCGVLVKTTEAGLYESIKLTNLTIKDVFYENSGFVRDSKETNTANGTQKYGWGIRFINRTENAILKDVTVQNCDISNVSHTGLQLNGKVGSIEQVRLSSNKITNSGGPGMQMSGVKNCLVNGNVVNGSGSKNDTRNWSRGSGLWTWSCTDILIERNTFMNANGPGDSAGCHIDFNCKNVVIQYNYSSNNAGGFIEILGNNYNCAYRYNISVNDGYRIKGKNGAFQEGKMFWLSGYVGDNVPPKGPYNSYIYNNTIYTKKDIAAQIAVTTSASGVLIANNIFHIEGQSRLVAGDQKKFERMDLKEIPNAAFENNLFLANTSWPKEVLLQDRKPIIGDALFKNKGGLNLEDYTPTNRSLIKDKGIEIKNITDDKIGLTIGLKMKYDILGNKITGKPDIGAIEIK